jgi:hypothetical protein
MEGEAAVAVGSGTLTEGAEGWITGRFAGAWRGECAAAAAAGELGAGRFELSWGGCSGCGDDSVGALEVSAADGDGEEGSCCISTTAALAAAASASESDIGPGRSRNAAVLHWQAKSEQDVSWLLQGRRRLVLARTAGRGDPAFCKHDATRCKAVADEQSEGCRVVGQSEGCRVVGQSEGCRVVGQSEGCRVVGQSALWRAMEIVCAGWREAAGAVGKGA